ncbi:MAG: methyltransferase domain-containing protein [Bacteroidales bacterium]
MNHRNPGTGIARDSAKTKQKRHRMKQRNPKNRYDLPIGKKDRVLEVGGGHDPHPRSNVVVDKYIDSNYHRKSDIKVYGHQTFLQADGENLPFEDKSFDFVICNQVLEHVEDPEAFLREQMRVAQRGYLETPSLVGEYLFPKKSHKWLVLELEGKLILIEKEKFWFSTGLDFGFLFLTWLQKTSLAYKILTATRPDMMTVRYQWDETIDFEVNPDNPAYVRYFREAWTEEMTRTFFPQTSKWQETLVLLRTLAGIMGQQIARNLRQSLTRLSLSQSGKRDTKAMPI